MGDFRKTAIGIRKSEISRMTTRRIEKIRKRDGRIVDYDEAKLAEAIHRAARAAGHEKRYLADDLAGVVTTYLERYHDREVPGQVALEERIQEVQRYACIAQCCQVFRIVLVLVFAALGRHDDGTHPPRLLLQRKVRNAATGAALSGATDSPVGRSMQGMMGRMMGGR